MKIKFYNPFIFATLLHRLILSIELGTVQTGTGKVDPARKFKCTTAARDMSKLRVNRFNRFDIYREIRYLKIVC